MRPLEAVRRLLVSEVAPVHGGLALGVVLLVGLGVFRLGRVKELLLEHAGLGLFATGERSCASLVLGHEIVLASAVEK